MKIGLFWRVMPAYFIVIALFALPLWQRHMAEARAKQDLAFYQTSSPAQKTNKYVEGKPATVIIPSVGIKLPVEQGIYDVYKNTWSVSSVNANYAFNTVKNNTKAGGTLIYGHWTQQVFGPTDDLKSGDKAIVITENGHKFVYVYKSDETLNPTDTQLFKELQVNKPRLALMTCKGLWSQERRVMYFDLEGIE